MLVCNIFIEGMNEWSVKNHCYTCNDNFLYHYIEKKKLCF